MRREYATSRRRASTPPASGETGAINDATIHVRGQHEIADVHAAGGRHEEVAIATGYAVELVARAATLKELELWVIVRDDL